MIINEDKRKVESTLTGETAKFTIAATGKAFRILVDGLYSDKVGSIVREITSNAWDAHTRAGTNATPFEVRLPNSLNPTFSVRDYGCSMTHEMVMGTYSTLFDSSKSSSNDEVGAFGLGAKSVFAYTDAYTVNCWLGGELRAYAIGLDEDGVPSVTLVHRAPSTEKQGVEVTFAVSQYDFQKFNAAFAITALGYDTPPTVVGGSVVVPQPVFRGAGWRMYTEPNGYGNSKPDMVRQGCAVYPAGNSHYKAFAGYYMVMDVKIGSANVTASREALALTSDQARKIEESFNVCKRELNAQVKQKYDACADQYEKAKFACDNEKLLGHSYPMHIDFPSDTTLKPTVTPTGATVPPPSGILQFKSNVHVTKTHVRHLDRMKIVYDDGTKIIRRQRRLNALANSCDLYITTNQAHALAMCKVAHLKPGTQLIPISAIPDVYVAPKGTGTARAKKVVVPTRPWAISNNGNAVAGTFRWTKGRGTDPGLILNCREQKFIRALLPPEGLLFLTELEHVRAVKKGTIVGEDFRIDNVVKKALAAHTQEVADYYKVNAFAAIHVSTVRAAMVKRAGLDTLKIATNDLAIVFTHVLHAEALKMEQAGTTIRLKLAAHYPLLFGYDEKAVASYIDAVDSVKPFV